MASDYQIQTDVKYSSLISALLQDAPPFLSIYQESLAKTCKPATQYIYLGHLLAFIQFERDIIPECNDFEIKDMPEFIFDKLTETDLQRYQDFLQHVRSQNKRTIHEHFVALSTYYKYLNRAGITRNNPFLFFNRSALPVKQHQLRLDDRESRILLDGIFDNKLYLSHTEQGDIVAPIPHRAWIKRELNVLRNHAICALLLYTEIDISSLAGLDVPDVQLNKGYLSVPSSELGEYDHIKLSSPVNESLARYLSGIQIPDSIYDNELKQRMDAWAWAHEHIRDTNPEKKARSSFQDEPEEFYQTLLRLTDLLRRQGRKAYWPKPSEKALFLSSRGTRMTVRMIEYMVKEMLRTYLPDSEIKDITTPNRLRKF